MMYISRLLGLFLALSTLVFLTLSNANARTPNAGVPQFVPMGAWQVGPTEFSQIRGLSGVKLPCMMMTNYDNGYTVRFSGGQSQMLAMAIDFRQNVFTQGRKYPVRLSFGESYVEQVTATAFSTSTLIINLRPLDSFYQNLAQAQMMQLAIEGNVMRFTMSGIGNALQRLEACYNPSAQPQNQAASMQNASAANSIPMPRPPENESWNEASNMANAPVQPVMPQVWEAKAGDSLQSTLERWGAMAGVNVEWQAGQTGQVSNDVRVSGTFEEAVQLLMAQNAAAMGIEANLMGAQAAQMVANGGSLNSTPQQLMPNNIGMQGANAGNMNANSSGQWSAPSGSNLQQVLGIWSQKAGVDFVWNSNVNFRVMQAINMSGSYEDALQALLTQYTNERVRPSAQLNNDPTTGKRSLFVESTRL
jgi:hypothetical protein